MMTLNFLSSSYHLPSVVITVMYNKPGLCGISILTQDLVLAKQAFQQVSYISRYI